MSTKRMELLTEGAVDVLVLYHFLKKLTTPFEEWEAYKLGIIDKDGNVLRKRSTLTSSKEKNAFDLFDLFVRNIKRLIERLPGGKSKIATYVAGLFLMKEEAHSKWYMDEDIAYEAFTDFYEAALEVPELEKEMADFLKLRHPEIYNMIEDAPANSVNTGAHVAGLREPVVRCTPKKRKNFKDCI